MSQLNPLETAKFNKLSIESVNGQCTALSLNGVDIRAVCGSVTIKMEPGRSLPVVTVDLLPTALDLKADGVELWAVDTKGDRVPLDITKEDKPEPETKAPKGKKTSKDD